MTSKLGVFWKKNRGIAMHIMKMLFLLQTIAYTVIAIVYLIKGDPIYGTMYFSGAIVAGAITFGLVKFSSGTLL
jgi:hypothetical protein